MAAAASTSGSSIKRQAVKRKSAPTQPKIEMESSDPSDASEPESESDRDESTNDIEDDDLLNCSICLGPFADPITTACGHSFW